MAKTAKIVKLNALSAPGAFDYTEIDSQETRELAWNGAAQIASSVRTIKENAYIIGKTLTDVRAALEESGDIGNGLFTKWADSEFPELGARARQYLMKTYDVFPDQENRAWMLMSPTALRSLAAADEETREAVLDMAEDYVDEEGKQPSVKTTQEMIEEAKAAQRDRMQAIESGHLALYDDDGQEAGQAAGDVVFTVEESRGEFFSGPVRFTWNGDVLMIGSRRSGVTLSIEDIYAFINHYESQQVDIPVD